MNENEPGKTRLVKIRFKDCPETERMNLLKDSCKEMVCPTGTLNIIEKGREKKLCCFCGGGVDGWVYGCVVKTFSKI